MIAKAYRVRNWSEYNRSLVNRGRITLWIDQNTLEQWRNPPKHGKRGRPYEYANEVILSALCIKNLCQFSLRFTQGFLMDLLDRLNLDLKSPNYTTLCRRQKTLDIKLPKSPNRKQDLNIVVDSTGLKVYGEGEWKTRQHGIVKKRLWRKLHVAVNCDDLMIESCLITDLGTQDCQGFSELLDGIEGPINKAIGDGAYDRFSCYEVMEDRGATGIFPPQHNAVTSKERTANRNKGSPGAVAKRDKAIEDVRLMGKKEWKIENGYHRRSLAETTIFRLKTIFGRNLRARNTENQIVEAQIRCLMLNKMTLLGMPKTIAI